MENIFYLLFSAESDQNKHVYFFRASVPLIGMGFRFRFPKNDGNSSIGNRRAAHGSCFLYIQAYSAIIFKTVRPPDCLQSVTP